MKVHTCNSSVKEITAAILIVTFVYAFVNSISSVMLNEVVESFSLTGVAQGLLSSMLSVGYMLALLINPLFQGRTEKLAMLLFSGILQVTMIVVSGITTHITIFIVAIVFLGVGCGWLDGYINSGMIDVHPRDSSKYLGMLHGIFGIGSLIAPLMIQVLLLKTSWRGVCFIIAVQMAVAIVIVALARKRTGHLCDFRQIEEAPLSIKEYANYLINKRNLLLLSCGAMCAFVQTGVTCWIVRYMFLKHQDTVIGATCLTAYWVAATINRFLTPCLHFRPLALIVGGGIISSVWLSVGILSENAAVMCACFGLLGLTSGHFIPIMVAECAKGYQGSTTLTTSVYMFVTGIARVIVPILMAALSNMVSIQIGMSVPVFAGILVTIFSAIVYRIPTSIEASS